MPYREPHDELRAQIEQVERELASSRHEAARVRSLERELDELRAKLTGRKPSRRPWIIALATVTAAFALAATMRSRVTENVVASAPPAPARPGAQSALDEKHLACVGALPRNAQFRVVRDFEHIDGTLDVTWHIAPAPSPPPTRERALEGPPPASSLRVDFASQTVIHGELLGVHLGEPFTSELSYCRDAPNDEGPCTRDPLPAMPGVVSEMTLQYWVAYYGNTITFWLLVRGPQSMWLLKSDQARGGRLADDRDLCTAGAWEVVLEVLLPTTTQVREKVLYGEPALPFDCAKWSARDLRCTG